jgi:DNA modification methylase
MGDVIINKDNGTTHRLINADCLTVQGLPVFDAVITDTPFGTTNCKWDSVLQLNDYIQHRSKLLSKDEYILKLVSDGTPYDDAVLLWEGNNRKGVWSWLHPLRKPTTPILLFSQLPYDKVLGVSNVKELKYEWIWEKTSATGHLNAKKMPMKCHENILVFYNKLPVYNYEKTTGHVRKTAKKGVHLQSDVYNYTKNDTSYDSTERYPRDILKYASDKQKINLNSTQKPLELLRYLVRTYTNVGDTILDFTAGSMALAVACYLEGRNSVCIEMDKEQYDTSKDWLENCTLDNPYKLIGE